MTEQWKRLVVTRITLAMKVSATGGKKFHQNRPAHGLILNDACADKDYVFSDGRVLHTEGNELFYLPKGSTYQVKTYQSGSCYVINFDAELSGDPFTMGIRDVESLRKVFHRAAKQWKAHDDTRELLAMSALYEIVREMVKEREKGYLPAEQTALLSPALESLRSSFSDHSLTVAELAARCGISEVYFRRIFRERFGISPKEYLIRLRMDYAKQLLASGQFTVTEVAGLCGYGEPCHFSREFLRHVGCPPREYKNAY